MNNTLTKSQLNELAKLREQSNCGKDPRLCDQNFNNLPRVQQVRSDGLLECLDKRAVICPMAVYFGDSYFCKCPARTYLYQEFGV